VNIPKICFENRFRLLSHWFLVYKSRKVKKEEGAFGSGFPDFQIRFISGSDFRLKRLGAPPSESGQRR